MKQFVVHPIGEIRVKDGEMAIVVDKKYIPALQGIEGFGHLSILWWFSELDNEEARSYLEMPAPYKNAPEVMGIFATRGPVRPNPIALTTVKVLHIDHENGVITIPYIDANDGSPVLDIKPYTPSIDRIEKPVVPAWCANWPASYETSGDFDWSGVFLFEA